MTDSCWNTLTLQKIFASRASNIAEIADEAGLDKSSILMHVSREEISFNDTTLDEFEFKQSPLPKDYSIKADYLEIEFLVSKKLTVPSYPDFRKSARELFYHKQNKILSVAVNKAEFQILNNHVRSYKIGIQGHLSEFTESFQKSMRNDFANFSYENPENLSARKILYERLRKYAVNSTRRDSPTVELTAHDVSKNTMYLILLSNIKSYNISQKEFSGNIPLETWDEVENIVKDSIEMDNRKI